MKKNRILVMAAVALAAVAAATGCKMLSNGASEPTAFERRFYDVTNVSVPQVTVTTHYLTNVVPVTVQQVVTNTVTNSVGVTVTVTNTEVVQAFATNVTPVQTFATNITLVPQLVVGKGAATTTTIGGAIAAPFGFGGIVTTVLGGLFAGWAGLRNRALAGKASIANQTAGILTQNIETILNVLSSTPQGLQVVPMVKNYLMAHQAQAGVIQQVATAIDTFVDEPAAHQSAEEILKALSTIQGAPTTSTATTKV